MTEFHTLLKAMTDFADFEPDPEIKNPGLVIIGLIIAGWGIVGGVLYCAYRALEAIAS